MSRVLPRVKTIEKALEAARSTSHRSPEDQVHQKQIIETIERVHVMARTDARYRSFGASNLSVAA
jgi:hypothetical protein